MVNKEGNKWEEGGHEGKGPGVDPREGDGSVGHQHQQEGGGSGVGETMGPMQDPYQGYGPGCRDPESSCQWYCQSFYVVEEDLWEKEEQEVVKG